MLETATFSMRLNDVASAHTVMLQMNLAARWIARLPPTTSRIRLVMNCTDGVADVEVDEWLHYYFPWKRLAGALHRRNYSVVEVHVIHEFFVWEEVLGGSQAERYLQAELNGTFPLF